MNDRKRVSIIQIITNHFLNEVFIEQNFIQESGDLSNLASITILIQINPKIKLPINRYLFET